MKNWVLDITMAEKASQDGVNASMNASCDATGRHNQYLKDIAGLSVITLENHLKAQDITAQLLRQASLNYLQSRTLIISSAFPEVLIDACHFMSISNGLMPWEFAAGDEEAEAMAIKYEVSWNRQRPNIDEIDPMTNIFFECAKAVQDWSDLIRANPSAAQEVLLNLQEQIEEDHRKHFESLPPEEMKKYKFPDPKRTQLHPIYEMAHRIAPNEFPKLQEEFDADYGSSIALDRRSPAGMFVDEP